MRVLFLNPPFHPRFSREQRSPAVTKSGTLYYPKWLATAAGVAIKNGHEVDLVDAPAGGFSVKAVIDRIASKNIEAVVCDTSTPSILNDISVVEAMVARVFKDLCQAWCDLIIFERLATHRPEGKDKGQSGAFVPLLAQVDNGLVVGMIEH